MDRGRDKKKINELENKLTVTRNKTIDLRLQVNPLSSDLSQKIQVGCGIFGPDKSNHEIVLNPKVLSSKISNAKKWADAESVGRELEKLDISTIFAYSKSTNPNPRHGGWWKMTKREGKWDGEYKGTWKPKKLLPCYMSVINAFGK